MNESLNFEIEIEIESFMVFVYLIQFFELNVGIIVRQNIIVSPADSGQTDGTALAHTYSVAIAPPPESNYADIASGIALDVECESVRGKNQVRV